MGSFPWYICNTAATVTDTHYADIFPNGVLTRYQLRARGGY